MNVLLLSDIHANLSALDAVVQDAFVTDEPDALILLGDNVDYGMRPNETVERIRGFIDETSIPVLASVWGNHEDAILNGNLERFSTERGRKCARNTAQMICEPAKEWLTETAESSGRVELDIEGRSVLITHGSIQDPLWGKLGPALDDYAPYRDFDVVISGHSHIPSAFTVLIESDNPTMRNKKAVEFINPGSVGQPRHHDPRACYAIWDTDHGVRLNHVEYDVAFEQSLYSDAVDDFYKERLALGV